jgi:hypothetical protein
MLTQNTCSRISVIAMNGAAISIDSVSAADKIISIKQRVFAANHKLSVRRQRLVYQPGPFGMDPLADDETLGGAGVAQDGSAKLDVLLADLTAAELAQIESKARCLIVISSIKLLMVLALSHICTVSHYIYLIYSGVYAMASSPAI